MSIKSKKCLKNVKKLTPDGKLAEKILKLGYNMLRHKQEETAKKVLRKIRKSRKFDQISGIFRKMPKIAPSGLGFR